MNIREAGKADSLAIEQISRASGYPVPELALDGDKIREMFAKKDIFFIAEVKEEPIGYVAIRPTSSDRLEIDSLEVRKGHHNQGVGTALIEKVEGKAKELGVEDIFLYCHPRNREAMTFYHELGYDKRGMAPSHYSTGEPAVLFSKKIN